MEAQCAIVTCSGFVISGGFHFEDLIWPGAIGCLRISNQCRIVVELEQRLDYNLFNLHHFRFLSHINGAGL